MTPKMYEIWDQHIKALQEEPFELTPEQESEWLSHNAIDDMSAVIAIHSEEDAVGNKKKKKKSDSTAKPQYGILYAEKSNEKETISSKRRQGLFHKRATRKLKKIVPIWAQNREGANKKYHLNKKSNLVIEGE